MQKPSQFFSQAETSGNVWQVTTLTKHSNVSRINQHRTLDLGIFLPFLNKFGPKKQNCLCKMEFRT